MARVPVQRSDEATADESWTIVQRAQAGDQDAVAELYRQYQPNVLRFLYFRTGNKAVAEDLASDVWLRSLKALPRFEWQGKNVGAWLMTIARNMLADHFKSGRYRLEVAIGDVLTVETSDDRAYAQPESTAVDYLTNTALMAGVKELTGEQRECIILRFLRGLSVAETAAVMGKNEGAIKALQFRAVGALRRMFPDAQDFGLPEPVIDVPDRPERVEDPARTEAVEARLWASSRGVFVPKTGRVPSALLEAYRAQVTP
jgi:RNA polymerase sigma-70 factor, ECF subfamily